MSKTQYYIQKGFLFKKQDQKDTLGLFNLNKLIKETVKDLHVTTFDDCCDTEVVDAGGPFPVSFEDGALQYFNGTDDVAIVVAPTFPSGTAAAPGIAFTADPDTGIYNTANVVGISAGGAARASFSTTGVGLVGDVAISTTGSLNSPRDQYTIVAKNSTGTINFSQSQFITSTSVAPVVLTTSGFFSVAVGTESSIFIDNHTGANTVTIDLTGATGSSVISSPAVTGMNNLVVAAGKVGLFKCFYIASGSFVIIRQA